MIGLTPFKKLWKYLFLSSFFFSKNKCDATEQNHVLKELLHWKDFKGCQSPFLPLNWVYKSLIKSSNFAFVKFIFKSLLILPIAALIGPFLELEFDIIVLFVVYWLLTILFTWTCSIVSFSIWIGSTEELIVKSMQIGSLSL